LGVAACVEVRRAAQALAAVRAPGPELPMASSQASGGGKQGEPPDGNTLDASDGKNQGANAPRSPAPRSPEPPMWESLLVRIVRAISGGAAASVRDFLPSFVAHFRREPLLYCPPSDGGKPREVLQAQTALAVLEDLVTRLPRLGLLRETFQLTKLARQMEWNNPPEGRRVSSFDQLFRTAL